MIAGCLRTTKLKPQRPLKRARFAGSYVQVNESTLARRARRAKFSHTLVWPLELGLRTPTLQCDHLSGPSGTRRGFFDFEVGGHDGAYKGRAHVIVPLVGRII